MTDGHSGLSKALVLIFTPTFLNSNLTSSSHLNCSLHFSPPLLLICLPVTALLSLYSQAIQIYISHYI